jgi:hypothetical protein
MKSFDDFGFLSVGEVICICSRAIGEAVYMLNFSSVRR